MKSKLWVKLAAGVLSAAMVISMGGCGSSTSSGTASGASNSAAAANKADSLTIGLSADPSTLEPMVQSGQAVRLIKMCMYRGLLAYESDGSIGNEIAESYEVADDNVTYTFHIRQNAKFQDGSDITAEDVKFSFERQLDASVSATF
ncbi:MAG: ABC transporter substrate-binding protein, partial [Oscillospiraceae bacterium]|nr:ABC transporter substrate-binding protein [Oscillospiraceae bacterium]